MSSADLDHLVFLPRGNTALTRRAKNASSLSAVVSGSAGSGSATSVRACWSSSQRWTWPKPKCLADEEARERRRRRGRDEAHRVDDVGFQADFARAIKELFPGCPADRAEAIAAHAALRGSGRVGRSVSGRKLEPEAVTLAVVASVRHSDTRYDSLLMAGVERAEARGQVRSEVDRILSGWSGR